MEYLNCQLAENTCQIEILKFKVDPFPSSVSVKQLEISKLQFVKQSLITCSIFLQSTKKCLTTYNPEKKVLQLKKKLCVLQLHIPIV